MRGWFLSVSLLACVFSGAAFAIPAVPASCSRPAVTASCKTASGGDLTGYYVSWNDGAWQAYDFSTPLSPAAGQRVAVAICNQGNVSIGDAHWPTVKSLIPTLVKGLGANASVGILVSNSANVTVGTQLVLGENPLSTGGGMTGTAGDAEPALISELIVGPVGEGARIDVQVLDSANVLLANADSHLHIGGGSLMDEMIDQSDDTGETALGACIHADIQRTSRVMGHQGLLTIDTGQLENETIDYGLKNSLAYISKTDVGTVAVTKIRLSHGELVDETIDAGALEGNLLSVRFQRSAKVAADSLEIDNGELVDETIDGGAVSHSLIDVNFIDSANASLTSGLDIDEGELVDEAIDVGNVQDSTLKVAFSNSANLTAPAGALTVSQGELVDEAVDGAAFNNVQATVAFDQSANAGVAQAGIEQGQLIDEAMDGASFADVNLSVSLLQSGNLTSPEAALTSSQLIDELLDAEGALTRALVNISLSGAGNAQVSSLLITDGELIDEVIDALQVSDSNLQIRAGQSASVQRGASLPARSLQLVRGSLFDELLDIGQAWERSTETLTVLNSATARAERITLDDARLLDKVLDTGSVSAAFFNIGLLGTANAYYRDALSLTGGSRLLGTHAVNAPPGSVIYNAIQSGQSNRVTP